jgi:hypothetical protein
MTERATKYVVARRWKSADRPLGRPMWNVETFRAKRAALKRFDALSMKRVGYAVLSYGFGNVLHERGRGQ